MMRRLARRWRDFARDTSGSYSIEAVMVLPILVWAGIATLTYVDGYRTQTMNLRVTYSMSDLLSRQWDPVGPNFVDGLGRLHDYLVGEAHPTRLRVTVLDCAEFVDMASPERNVCEAEEDDLRLVWSDSTDDAAAPPLDASTLDALRFRIPRLAHGDTMIVVETWLDHTPAFNIGLGSSTFYNLATVSPRFIPQLRYEP